MIVYNNPEAYEQIIFGGDQPLTDEELELIYGEGIGSFLATLGKTAMRGIKASLPFLKTAGKSALKFAKSPAGQKLIESSLSVAGTAILDKIKQNRAARQGEGLQEDLTTIYNTLQRTNNK